MSDQATHPAWDTTDARVVLAVDGHELRRNELADHLLAGRPLAHALTDESWAKLTRALTTPRRGMELVTVEGAVWDVAAVPLGDRQVGLALRDVSRYAAAAEKLATVTTELSRRNRDLATLDEVGAQMSSTLNLAELGETACRLVAHYFAAHAVAVDVGGHCYSWPDRPPPDPPDGSTPLRSATGIRSHLRWWRESPLDPGEERLVAMIAARAAIAFDNAVLHAATARQASHDPLTGLLNRDGVERLLPTLAYPAAVALVDLDHFKVINDQHGHDTGDHVLTRVAQSLTALRSTEVAARWGGEEFLLLCPATTATDAAVAVDRVRARLAEAVHVAGRSVTFSAGIAPLAAPEDFISALAHADTALYRAKRDGRNRVEIA